MFPVCGFVNLYNVCTCRQYLRYLQWCKVTSYFGDELRDLEFMVLLGKIEQFDPEQGEWAQYVERLEQFFKVNDLTGVDKADKQEENVVYCGYLCFLFVVL